MGHGLQDPRSKLFWEMLRVLRHLQLHQPHPPAYILENVPLLGDSRQRVVASVHQVRSWIGSAVLLDAAQVGSCAHRPRLWWTNLAPLQVLKRAFDNIPRPPKVTVDAILDAGRRSQRVYQTDRPPLALVNKVGCPRAALPTLVSHPASYAYRAGGPGLIWDESLKQLVEPNASERERAMGFRIGTTAVPSVTEGSRRQVLGQAMDLNCLTWIISLGIAEQRRLRTSSMTSVPLVSSGFSGTVETRAGGEHNARPTVAQPQQVVPSTPEKLTEDNWEPQVGPKLTGGEKRKVQEFLRMMENRVTDDEGSKSQDMGRKKAIVPVEAKDDTRLSKSVGNKRLREEPVGNKTRRKSVQNKRPRKSRYPK